MTDNNQQKLSATLGLPTTIERTFFKPESAKQRVLVQDVRAFGADGKGIVLIEKNPDGSEKARKPAKCFAEVDLLDAESLRSSTWQVLSKPAAVQLGRAIDDHGSNWRHALLIDVHTTGRGMQKEFHVSRVSNEQLARELKDTEAEVAAIQAKQQVATQTLEDQVVVDAAEERPLDG